MKTNNLNKIALGLLVSLSLNANAHDVSDVEHFPKDYFLVHKNMPHYMKVFRKFGDDNTLGLSDEQKKETTSLARRSFQCISSRLRNKRTRV